jgi:RNA polymerase primary sigma factor
MSSKLLDVLPPLSLQEETKLFALHKTGTEAEKKYARDKIITHNLRFVALLTKNVVRFTDERYDDLFMEGTRGLVKAFDMFDTTSGYKFITYAVWWIKQHMYRALDTSHLVHIPSQKIKADNKYRKQHRGEIANGSMPAHLDFYPTFEQLEYAGEDGKLVDNSALTALVDFEAPLRDVEEKLVTETQRRLLEQLALEIPVRDYEILRLYYGLDSEPLILADIGARFDISKERVRQIISRSIHKMRSLGMKPHLRKVYKQTV